MKPEIATDEQIADPKTFVWMMALWESYRAAVIDQNAGIQQIVESRRAFFAGAQSMFTQLHKVDELDEAEACGRFSAYAEELRAFARCVTAGIDHNALHIGITETQPGPKQ